VTESLHEHLRDAGERLCVCGLTLALYYYLTIFPTSPSIDLSNELGFSQIGEVVRAERKLVTESLHKCVQKSSTAQPIGPTRVTKMVRCVTERLRQVTVLGHASNLSDLIYF
jgi:hypothetical protein